MLPISLGLVVIASSLAPCKAHSKPEHDLYTADIGADANLKDIPLFARDKRSGGNPILLAGRYITGAIKTKSKNGMTEVYQKPGNQKRARKDFYRLEPMDVQHLSFPYGGNGLAGRVGSHTVVYRRRDIAEDHRPTLEIFIPGTIEPEIKVVYGTKTKFYYPNFYKQ